MSTRAEVRLSLHRTGHPASLRHMGEPLCPWWFVYVGRAWGVSAGQEPGGHAAWEVFDSASMATVGDDYDRLADVRTKAAADCDVFLSDTGEATR